MKRPKCVPTLKLDSPPPQKPSTIPLSYLHHSVSVHKMFFYYNRNQDVLSSVCILLSIRGIL